MRYLYLLLIVLMCGTAEGQVFTWTDTGEWVRIECWICSKTIYEWRDYSNFDSSASWDMRGLLLDGEEKITIGMTMLFPVCKSCNEKYWKDVRDVLLKSLGDWITIKQEEYKDIRIQNEQERQQSDIQLRQKEIIELNKQIYELQKEETE